MKNREQKLKMSNGNALCNFAWLRGRGAIKEKHLMENERVIARNTSYTDKEDVLKETWEYYICNSRAEYLNLIVDNPDSNLCEYIHTSKRKLYFDFDLKKSSISRERANEVLELLVEKINKHFSFAENKITRNDVIVFARDKDEIKSLHFIVPKYSTTRENLSIFSKILKEEEEAFDTRVYDKRKAFCLKYQSKVFTDKPFERHFTSFNSVSERLSENVNNYLIVETDKTKFVELTGETHKVIEEVRVAKKMKEIAFDEVVEALGGEVVCSKNNIVDLLLNNLPTDFFSNWGHNPKWKYTTKILNCIGVKDIDDWLTKSADKSNGNFTGGQNKSWFESISSTDEWINYNINQSGIQNHLDNINKSFGKSQHSLDKCKRFLYAVKPYEIMDTPLLRKWLVKWTGKSKTEIANIYNDDNIKITDNTISIGENHKLYQKTMTLENVASKTQRNFYIDSFSEKNNINKSSFIENDRETLIKLFQEDLENPQIKLIGINAKWGMRKTSLFIDTAIRHYADLKQKMLIPTESNSLNMEFYDKLKKKFPTLNIMTHQHLQQEQSKEFPPNLDITICSMESILKCSKKVDFDLCIFDEFESMVLHLESPTMSTQKIEPHLYLNKMKDRGIKCKKILCLDADLTEERLKPLLDNLNIGKDASKCYYMTDNKWLDYKFNVWVDNEGAFWDDMEKNILNDKKVVVATLSAQKILTIDKKINLLKVEQKIKSSKNTLVCVSESDGGLGWKYNGQPLSKIPRKDGYGFYSTEEVRENVSAFIIEMEVDYWLYSPTIKTGISFDKPEYFDVVYGKSNNFSCVAREFIQMLFRVREPKEHIINIHIDMFTNPKKAPSEEVFRSCLNKNMALPLYQLNKKEKDIDWVKLCESVKLCPLYEEWKIINLREKWLSQNNLPHEICRLLYHNHGLKLNFIHREENPDIIEKLDACRKMVKSEELELLRCIELLQPNDFSLKTKYVKPSPIDYQKLKKRKIINKLGKYSCKESYDKKMLDLEIHEAHDEWVKESEFDFIENNYIKQPIPIIDINNLWGYEYSSMGEKIVHIDPNIIYEPYYHKNQLKQYMSRVVEPLPTRNPNHQETETRIWTYANIFHDKAETLQKIINAPAELNYINYNNDRPLPTEEIIYQDINTELTDSNKWKMYYKFLSRFAPFIFVDKETTTIKVTEHQLSVKDYKLSMVENEDWIKKNMNDFMLIAKNQLKERDWSKFNASKSKDRKDFYGVFKSALGHYGLNIHAPKHKEVDKQLYKIKPAPRIYHNKPHKELKVKPLTITNPNLYSTTKNKITTNKTKNQTKYFNTTYHPLYQKNYSEVYGDKPIDLYERPNSKNLKNYPYREIEFKKTKSTFDKEIEFNKVIDCIENREIEFLKFFLRFKPNNRKTLTKEEYKKINPIKKCDIIPIGNCLLSDFEATDEEHPKITEYYKKCSEYYNKYKHETMNNLPHRDEKPYTRPVIDTL